MTLKYGFPQKLMLILQQPQKIAPLEMAISNINYM